MSVFPLKTLLLFSFVLFASFEPAFLKSYREVKDVGKLKFVNILYRHGDRTPIDPYPTDPYKNLSYWPDGYGQLTKSGKVSHYKLGTWLRETYKSLLKTGEYKKKLMYVQSTDVDRTLMSAECNLAAMFPPDSQQKWGSLDWQPIPVHTIPEDLDKLLAMKAPCKKYTVEYHKAKKSPFMQKINEKYAELYAYLTQHTGKNVHDIQSVDYIFSSLFIEEWNNYTLPEWTKTVYPEPMYSAAALSFYTQTMTPILKRLKSGPLVKQMITHMKLKVAGSLDKNLWVYSAHDTTIANLLNTLGVFDIHRPPFTSCVLIELREVKGENVVLISYKNETNKEPHVFTIPGCTQLCPLDKFESLLAPVIPGDWDAECHEHTFFDLTSDLPYNSLAIFDDKTREALNWVDGVMSDFRKRVPHGNFHSPGVPPFGDHVSFLAQEEPLPSFI